MTRSHSRPLYETSEDLSREGEVMSSVAKIWQCDYFKLPLSYRLDFALSRHGRVISLCEVRCRNNSIKKYPTMICSVSKREKALSLSDCTGVTSVFLVQWTDAIGFIDFAVKPDFIAVGGRTGDNRRDYEDVEILCHYSVEHFTLVDVKVEEVEVKDWAAEIKQMIAGD